MMTTEQIRSAGLEALQRRLGRAGMVRFLQIFSAGKGDYTKERRVWVDHTSLDDLLRRAEELRKARSGGKRASARTSRRRS